MRLIERLILTEWKPDEDDMNGLRQRLIQQQQLLMKRLSKPSQMRLFMPPDCWMWLIQPNPSYKKDVPQIPLYAFPNTARIPHLHIPVSTHYPIQFNPHPAITRFQFNMQYAFWTLSIRIQLKPHLPYSIWRSNGHNTQYVFLGRPLSKLLIREIHFMWNTTKPYSSG